MGRHARSDDDAPSHERFEPMYRGGMDPHDTTPITRHLTEPQLSLPPVEKPAAKRYDPRFGLVVALIGMVMAVVALVFAVWYVVAPRDCHCATPHPTAVTGQP